MTLEEAQKAVDSWIKEYGVKYFSVQNNTLILMEEVGEFARLVVRQFGEQSYREGQKEGKLDDEMADILFVLICLANQSGINLERALKENIEKKTQRDSDRHKSNTKLS